MRVYYKPNKNGTGCLANWSFNSATQSFYIMLCKQRRWDEKTKKGSFSGGDQINVKLGMTEIGGFLQAIETKDNYSFFHVFNDVKTSGNFNYSEKKSGETTLRGFVLFIKSGDKDWRVGFLLNEARELKEFMLFGLTHCYNALYAARKKEIAEYQKKKESQPSAPTTAPAPKAEEKDDSGELNF